MATVDLTPFGFTATESVVYSALLRLGPATGYGVGRATRLARANAYAALEGLVGRGAAQRASGRPAQYRPADPRALLARLAAEQGAALDRLSHALEDASHPTEPETRTAAGARAVANVMQQLVARATGSIQGIVAAELWGPTLPAWRRAATRATLDVRLAGEAPDAEGLLKGTVAAATPTVLLIDDSQLLTAAGAGEQITALWSFHPLLVTLARVALRSIA
jgi:HTH-type transcriptional regulator, sugar sensing transcriptional regulator